MNWCGELRIQFHVCSQNDRHHFINNQHLRKEVANSCLTKISEMFFFFLLLMDMTAGVPAVIPKVSKFNEIRI